MGGLVSFFSGILERHPVIFLGAGMSASMGYPTAAELARQISPTEDITRAEDFDRAAQALIRNRGRDAAIEIIKSFVKGRDVPPSQNPYHILKLILDKIGGEFVIATTNWDSEVDRTFGKSCIVKTPDDYARLQNCRIVVVKLHGDFDGPIVLTSLDANKSQQERERIYWHVFGASVAKPVVTLGYSAKDIDFLEWVRKSRSSIEFALLGHLEDARYPADNLVVGTDVIEFLKAEAKNFGIRFPRKLTKLKIYDEIPRKAADAKGRGKSLVCVSPRLSGKTCAYEATESAVSGFYPIRRDIGPSGQDNDNLLSIVGRIPAGDVFVIASPFAIAWAFKKAGISKPECEVLPIAISHEEALSILLECDEAEDLPGALKINEGELADSILEHSKSRFEFMGKEVTTYRPSLIKAHLRRLARERHSWSRSEAEFIDHAKKEFGRRERRIAEFVGTLGITSTTAAWLVKEPLAAIASGASLYFPPLTIATISVPALKGVISKLRGKEGKLHGLVELGGFWEELEPEEAEVLSERLDEKKAYPPGTSYRVLTRTFGDREALAQVNNTANDWLDRNRSAITRMLLDEMNQNQEFRRLVASISHEEVEPVITQIQAQGARLEKHTERAA